MQRRLGVVLVLAIAAGLIAAACGDDGDGDSPVTGPGISVTEALEAEVDGPLLVNGALHIAGGEVRLCEALAESFPPQCPTGYLVVAGLDLSSYELMSEGGVEWTDTQVQVFGDVEGDRLTVSGTSTR